MWFQKDSATAHRPDDSLTALEGVLVTEYVMVYGQHVGLILPHATFIYGEI
jgi:hypothetical protein